MRPYYWERVINRLPTSAELSLVEADRRMIANVFDQGHFATCGLVSEPVDARLYAVGFSYVPTEAALRLVGLWPSHRWSVWVAPSGISPAAWAASVEFETIQAARWRA